MHDIWNPWHGCVKCSEGCENSDGIKARNVKVISEMPGSMKISTPKGVFILNFGKDSL